MKAVGQAQAGPLRAALGAVSPYPAEKPLGRVQKELGLPGIVKLSSNESAFGPLPAALRAFRDCSGRLNRYPDSGALRLREALAERFDVDLDQVVIGNGADELIRLCGLAVLDRDASAVFPWPSFQSYVPATVACGGQPLRVPLRADCDLDLPALTEAASRSEARVLFLANPNNPTGRLYDRDRVRELLGATGGILRVLDEAYAEYADPEPEGPRLLREGTENLVVLRTFSKVHGLAALRVGYALTSAAIAEALDRVRPIYNVSQPAQEAALASLASAGAIRSRIDSVRTERRRVEAAMAAAGLRTHPSQANFVFGEGEPGSGRQLPGKLLAEGVMVRGMAPFGAADAVRVTVGSPSENQALIRALARVSGGDGTGLTTGSEPSAAAVQASPP